MEETELMIADCVKRKSKMNDWEQEFINSLANLIKNASQCLLTAPQAEKLEQIWDRVT